MQKFCQGVVLVKHDFPSSVPRTANPSSELVSRSARKRYPGRPCVYGSRSIPSTCRQMCGAEQVSILWRGPFFYLFEKKSKLITLQVQTASSIVPKRYPPFRSPHWEVTCAKNHGTNRINIGRSREHGSDGTRKEVNSGSVSQVGSALQVSLLMESWQLGDDNG